MVRARTLNSDEDTFRVRLLLPSAPGSGAALRQGLRASTRHSHRPTGQSKRQKRTHEWIKLGGKVTSHWKRLAELPRDPAHPHSHQAPQGTAGSARDPPLNKALHPSPRKSCGKHIARITSNGAFSHSLGRKQLFGARRRRTAPGTFRRSEGDSSRLNANDFYLPLRSHAVNETLYGLRITY
jgi:hypothetical protein